MLLLDIATNLYEHRITFHLSQNEVSDLTEISQKSLSKIENFSVDFRVSKLEKLSNGLELRPYELVIRPGDIIEKDLLEKKFLVLETVKMLYKYFLMTRQKNDADDGRPDLSVNDMLNDSEFMESLEKLYGHYGADIKNVTKLFENGNGESR